MALLQALIAEKISNESPMFKGKCSYAFSPSQFSKGRAEVKPPFCLVTLNGERLFTGSALKEPKININSHSFKFDRKVVLSCFFPKDKDLNAISAEYLENARLELIMVLGGWEADTCYYSAMYEGYSIMEDDAGLAWVDFYWCFPQLLPYDSIKPLDDTSNPNDFTIRKLS
jgi:hypothetical protein